VPRASISSRGSAADQLRRFIAKFDRRDQALIRAVRSALRRRLPKAFELVYDNYNFFVIGYGPTERPSDAVLSIAAGASGVGLCFLHGARLPDPAGILLGSGRKTRFVRLSTAATLKQPAVRALIDAAIARGKAFPTTGRGQLIIRSVSAKQRPRRRQAKGRAA
jgi:hypothetical protein